MDAALVDRVLRLKPVERFRLLEIPHGSLNRPDAEVDAAWYDEAKRRLEAHQAGRTQGVPASEVLGERP